MNKNLKTFVLVFGASALAFLLWQAYRKKQQSDAVEAAKKEELKTGSEAPLTAQVAENSASVQPATDTAKIVQMEVQDYSAPVTADTIAV